MSELVEFLRARLNEANERQQRIYRSTWEPGAPCPICERPTHSMRQFGGDPFRLASFEPCDHDVNDPALLTRFQEPASDPDVLADLDAKQRITDLYEIASASPELDRDAWLVLTETLKLLALPYAAHPDYDERWRP